MLARLKTGDWRLAAALVLVIAAAACAPAPQTDKTPKPFRISTVFGTGAGQDETDPLLLAQISGGAVVVLHEGTSARRDVVETTDWLLTRMAERGLRSVTLTEISRL